MKYELLKEDVNNILVFLNRTTLQGNEAEVLSSLKQKLANPLPEAIAEEPLIDE